MEVCTLLQTDNHASTPPLGFLQAGCPSCRPTNSVKALKDQLLYCFITIPNMKTFKCLLTGQSTLFYGQLKLDAQELNKTCLKRLVLDEFFHATDNVHKAVVVVVTNIPCNNQKREM